MQCPQCQHGNSVAAKFCEECGTRLVRVCPDCGHEVSPRAKFCPECGMPLTDKEPEGRRSGEAEKKAEEYFWKAIEIARQQRAKSWELRASTSLDRLWQQQGKQHEARTMLAKVYNWFTEGFDTKDVQEAKELIEELSH